MSGATPRGERFQREALAHALRYRCPHCIHMIPGDGACSLKYPNHMMRTPDLRCQDESGNWIFCKYFELDGT